MNRGEPLKDPRPPLMEHQKKALELSEDAPYFAYFMEQGTGKTYTILENAIRLYDKGKINSLLVFAPSGVHVNWVTDEAPKYIPERLKPHYHIWNSAKAQTFVHKWSMDLNLKHTTFSLLSVNIEAVQTEFFLAYLRRWIKAKNCMIAVDESDVIKSPSGVRTRKLWRIGTHSKFKRIATGTPSTQGPFDYYSQMRFLSPDILGFDTFQAFKTHHAEWEQIPLQSGRFYPSIKEDKEGNKQYRNLDELRDKIAKVSFRITKDECLDLPQKIFMPPVYYSMTEKQRKIYDDLSENLEAALGADGQDRVTVKNHLAKMVRIQQVMSNFYPESDTVFQCEVCEGFGCDVCSELGVVEGKLPERIIDPENNIRLKTFMDLIEPWKTPTIIWFRFTKEAEFIAKALKDMGRTFTVYTGQQSQEEKDAAKTAYLSGKAQFFISNSAGARGLTLIHTEDNVYYSCDFRYGTHVQSQDRSHRIGLRHPVRYWYITAMDSVDQIILKNYEGKRDLADYMNNDSARKSLAKELRTMRERASA